MSRSGTGPCAADTCFKRSVVHCIIYFSLHACPLVHLAGKSILSLTGTAGRALGVDSLDRGEANEVHEAHVTSLAAASGASVAAEGRPAEMRTLNALSAAANCEVALRCDTAGVE